MITNDRLGLNSNQLKCIAIITMTLDHVYKVFGYLLFEPLDKFLGFSQTQSYYSLLILFGIGNMTMYIFAWLIGEGCRYTSNIKKYIIRLFLFGLISEIPFQLMIKAIMGEKLSISFGLTNVMITFTLGVIACYGYKAIKSKIISIALLACCCLAAIFLQTDYSAIGVLAVFVCFVVNDRKLRLLSLCGVIVLARGIVYPLQNVISNGFQPHLIPYYLVLLAFSLISILVLSRYNGKRGHQSKYLFYIYYPLHMLIIACIYMMVS